MRILAGVGKFVASLFLVAICVLGALIIAEILIKAWMLG